MKTQLRQVLADKSATGKSRNWALHKLHSGYISLAYEEIDPKKSERMKDCAQWLSFFRREDGTMKLHDARFCRVRLCPVCQWRRSLKTFAQMSQVLDHANGLGYQFIFLYPHNAELQELRAQQGTHAYSSVIQSAHEV